MLQRPLRRLVVSGLSVHMAVCLILITGCTSKSSTTSTPRASFQARSVLQIVPPSSPLFGELKPACAESAGCPGVSLDPSNELVAIDKSGDRLQLGPAFLTETDISRAEATQIGGGGSATVQWAVAYELTPSGTDALAAGTSRATDEPPPRNQIAIVVDGVVLSAIAVQTPITSGEGTITGDFTEDSARSLASELSP